MGYNIVQPRNISQLPLIIFYLTPLSIIAQGNKTIDTPIAVVSSVKDYRASVQKDENQEMINLAKMIPTIQLDLRYASTNNFMHRKMYMENPRSTFMRVRAAKALMQVQKELNKKGLGLKIFDAYRPYSVSKDFWDLVHDERYVANPAKGSGHNRGIAVDLSIINLKTNEELKMPTGFDDFTDSAHHDFDDLPADVLANRALLKSTMLKYGFKAFATEWWHYSLPDSEKFPVLDLSFADLEGL